MSQPESPSNNPFAVEVEAGRKYWWCACGRSQNQPFCDGSHAGTEIGPVPLAVEKSGVLWFCGCKRSGKAPLCDGSHARPPKP